MRNQKNQNRSRKRELIDTLWNVNNGADSRYIGIKSELIDTLWNVNSISDETKKLVVRELIDTLWNVNLPGILAQAGNLSN